MSQQRTIFITPFSCDPVMTETVSVLRRMPIEFREALLRQLRLCEGCLRQGHPRIHDWPVPTDPDGPR
jgi:hypothetical protein